MNDRQSKELYQQQLAAHAAWLRSGAASRYTASQHTGFPTPSHAAAAAAAGSNNAAYESYVLQNMLGNASNILGNGAKDMAAAAGFSAAPFRFPGQFAANFGYQRPLPAHAPLSAAAHMKNSSSSTPITAHMISNPYQYNPANYGLNPSYGAAAGAMNPNYLQSNMAANQAAAAAASASDAAAAGNYMNQSADRFRQQFDQAQFAAASKDQPSSHRQENSRRQSSAAASMINGGMTAEASNAFNNLQQLQAAYSQAALSSNAAAMLKDAVKAKTPANNYSYYQPQTTTTSASSFGGGVNTVSDLNDQVAKVILSQYGDSLTPQLLQRLQQTASFTQSFQQQQQSAARTESAADTKSKTADIAGKVNSSVKNNDLSSMVAQDLRPSDRSSGDYGGGGGRSNAAAGNKDTRQPSMENAQSRLLSTANNVVSGAAGTGAGVQQEFQGYQPQSSNHQVVDYTAQYSRSSSEYRGNLAHDQINSQNRMQSYSSVDEIKTPTVQSPVGSQVSPASLPSSPAMQVQISPANSQVSPATNSQMSPAPQPPSFSPNHIPSADPKMSPYSQQSQMSPYSQTSPKMSPFSQHSPKMSPYSQPSPKMSPYSQHSPKMSPYSSQPSPKMPSASSSYPQHSPKMSPYSQPSPKMSPYSQVSPAYHQQPVLGAPHTSPSYPPKTISPVVATNNSLQQKADTAYAVPSYQQMQNQETSEPPLQKVAEVSLTNSKGNLRSNTDSPRLETPPGLTLPASTDEQPGRHSLPVIAPPVTARTEPSIQTKSISTSKATTTATTTSASSLFPTNPISSMASMTNKIRLLESKMLNAKSKTVSEDNSLMNWWKVQSDQPRKLKQTSGGMLTSSRSDLPASPVSSPPPPLSSEPPLKDGHHRRPGSPLSPQDLNLNGKNNSLLNREESASKHEAKMEKSSAHLKSADSPDLFNSLSKSLETNDRFLPSPSYLTSNHTMSPASSSRLLQEQTAASSATVKPKPASGQLSTSSLHHQLPHALVKQAAALTSKKSSTPSHLPNLRTDRTSSPVPYNSNSSESRGSSGGQPKSAADSPPTTTTLQYATPNLDRMEVKNSGIPGPSAVTWKRKSTEDSPISMSQAKKRKLDKSSASSTSSGNSNDIYHFDDEDKEDPKLVLDVKEDKPTKGPVYKYKNALISRDHETDSGKAKRDKSSLCASSTSDHEKDNDKDDPPPAPSLPATQDLLSAKKKNKRPKYEEWSVAKTKAVKSGGKGDKLPEEREDDGRVDDSRKGPVWGLPIIPKPSSQKAGAVEKPAEVVAPPPRVPTPEMPKKEVKVAADKWYQAFGASEVKNKKKADKVPFRREQLIKSEPEEKTVRSILDIPSEVRRKPRPNFGGMIHFGPDWTRLVKRHHERCRVPPGLDSSTRLNPKILVGQTTPKKSYEDYARKDMVSPPDLITLERERMEANAFTDIMSPKSPEEQQQYLGGELPSIVETILANRKKLRQGAKMGRMYQIPFQKEKKRMMRMRMSKGAPTEQAFAEDNMGLMPTPGMPLLTPDTRDVLLGNQSIPCFGNFRAYTLDKYLDYGDQGRHKVSAFSPEVLDSKTRSKVVSNLNLPSVKEVFGVDSPLKRVKGKKERKEPSSDREAIATPKAKKAKGSSKKEAEEKTETPTTKSNLKQHKIIPPAVVTVEKEEDDTFAFSQELGEPTAEENALQTELGGFALDLLEDNPSWVKQVTIQNLVVWEPVQPVSAAKKKKPKRKRGKKSSGWDFAVGRRKTTKTSREASRAGSPVSEEIHDIDYTLDNVIAESNRWVIDKNAGETILQRASKMGYPDVVAYAVGMQDMSVREKDYAGFTPLDKAAFRGHHEVAKILLKYGADPSSGVKGTRALHDAVEGASRETVRVLLEYGADPLLHNYSGNMPIDLAQGDKHMALYLVNILADLHGKPPNLRGCLVPPVQRWNVSHCPEFCDPRLDPRLRELFEEEETTAKDNGDNADGINLLDDFVFEVSSNPLPNEYQFLDRDGDFVMYRELKEFAKKFGHHKGDIKAKCYIIEMKKSEFLKTSHSKLLDRRRLEVRYHERELEDTIILVKVDKFVRKILNAERISIPR